MRLAAGLRPDPLGELTALPRLPSCVLGRRGSPESEGNGEGKGKGEKGRRREKRGGEKWKRGEEREGEGRECAPPIFTGAPHFLIPGITPGIYLQGRLRLTTARRLSAYMSSRVLATTTTSSFFYIYIRSFITSQYSTVVMIAKYRKSGIWGYRSSLTPEPVELK